jgi:hypothetical protein
VSDEWLKYAWLDGDTANDDLMAGCLGVATELDEATVLRELGVEGAPVGMATVREAWRMSESEAGNDLVQVSSVRDAVVTFEPNGWHGVESELAVRLSRSGRYAAYFWNVNAVMEFVFAEAGQVRRDFDPLLYDRDRERERAMPEELDLPFPAGDEQPLTPGRASLAPIERLTGVEIARSWLLDEAHPTYRVDPTPRATPA